MEDTKRTSSSSAPQLQDDVFLTQESYKKYSCRQSFVEYLEKHLNPKNDRENKEQNSHDGIKADITRRTLENSGDSSKGADKGTANSGPPCLGPSVEFPVVSKISIESQKMFVEVFETLRSGQLAKVDLQEMKKVQDMKNTVLMEQDEYQQFVYGHAKANHHLYNFIHPDVWDDFKADIDGKLTESINKYHRHYSLHETIGLAVGAVFKSDAVLTFEQTLLQVGTKEMQCFYSRHMKGELQGNIPKLSLPEDTAVMLLEWLNVPSEKSALEKTKSLKVVSEDLIAVSLARKYKVDIVISSSGLNTLLDNKPPDYRKQWQLPITVQRLEEGQESFSGHRIVFIDKPLPPQKVEPRDVNMTFYKRALRKFVCQKSGEKKTASFDCKEINTGSNVTTTERLHSKGLELEKTAFEADKIVNKEFTSTVVADSKNRKRRATEEEQITETKKPKISEVVSDPKVQNLEKETCKKEDEKFFVYNLWRFGKLKVLIRCSVDAYREERNKQTNFTFFGVFPKLEYQPNFGHEKLTYSEAARLWLNSYIRQNTKIICGRIDVYSSELLRVDELFINDILQQGTGFNPAQGMKMVFQVFQALKRLPEAKYLLSHKSGEIHGCLYKSVMSQSGSLKSSYDLRKTRTPIVINYTEAEIPWVAIDCNLFMPWQIHKRRIPCTFPPVSDKELAKMTKEAQEIAAKASKKTKKKKKKSKKNNKGRGKRPAQSKNSNTGPATKQSWKPNKKPKPLNKGKEKLFASFYDTQPAEKESEVFAISRRASGTISYDDLDF